MKLQALRVYMPQVVELARSAGEKILHIYAGSSYKVQQKKDDTPVTCADLEAHNLIVESLSSLQPSLPVLSEESEMISYEDRKKWEAYWLVDPLDGTREFIQRTGEFSVNIALIYRHQAILGVIHSPVSGDTWYACRETGAYKLDRNDHSQPISVKSSSGPSVTVVTGHRGGKGEKFERFLSHINDYEIIRMGSSLKSCLVAEGKADVYPRFGPTSEWDTAAAQCIVEQAGGVVADTHMNPLRYNMRESLLNPHFFVFGDKSVNWSAYLTRK